MVRCCFDRSEQQGSNLHYGVVSLGSGKLLVREVAYLYAERGVKLHLLTYRVNIVPATLHLQARYSAPLSRDSDKNHSGNRIGF